MTDYNDGKWHGWNGGECPVHPDAIVDIATVEGTSRWAAKDACWYLDPCGVDIDIIAFRVVESPAEDRKPREIWTTKNLKYISAAPQVGYTRWREVLDE